MEEVNIKLSQVWLMKVRGEKKSGQPENPTRPEHQNSRIVENPIFGFIPIRLDHVQVRVRYEETKLPRVRV